LLKTSSVFRKTLGVCPKSARICSSWRRTCSLNSGREKRKLRLWWLVSPRNSHAPLAPSSWKSSITSGAHARI